MRKGLPIALAGLLLVLAACSGTTSSGRSTDNNLHYIATLQSLNNSGATGTAEITLESDKLLVHVKLSGLVPSQSHAQHIHGDPGKPASCPPPTATDTNGLITLGSGAPYYGALAAGLDAPVASNTGVVDMTATVPLNGKDSARSKVSPLTSKVIVVHGMNVNGAYDGTVPVACGSIAEKS